MSFPMRFWFYYCGKNPEKENRLIQPNHVTNVMGIECSLYLTPNGRVKDNYYHMVPHGFDAEEYFEMGEKV